jgi:hypothetical protein
MNKHLLALATLILCAAPFPALAQPRAGMMGGAPHGPDFSGATGKLFGDNSSFSATLNIQASGATSSGSPTTMAGKIAVTDGKTRFEMDMTKLSGGGVDPQAAASMQSMGMGSMVMISRPDRKVTYLAYPGLNAYVENPLPDSTSNAPASSFKTAVTKLGEETVDGHACVKNKVVVTDDKGTQYESTVWNAADLKNFPVKIEQNENGSITDMTFKDIKFDKVATDQFEAPAGATKYDSMMSMMQQEMMKRAMQRGANPGNP